MAIEDNYYANWHLNEYGSKGLNVLLTIYPKGNTVFGSGGSAAAEIPLENIKGIKLNGGELDELPLGQVVGKSLEITFNLKGLENVQTGAPITFLDVLKSPYLPDTAFTYTPASGYDTAVSMDFSLDLANYCDLQIRDGSTVLYKFIGIQKVTAGRKTDTSTLEHTVEFIDATKTILESFDLDVLKYLFYKTNSFDSDALNGYVDIAREFPNGFGGGAGFVTGQVCLFKQNGKGDTYGCFYSLNTFQLYIEEIFEELAKKYLRQSTYSASFLEFFDYLAFYDQNFDTTLSLGSEILNPRIDVHMLGTITDKPADKANALFFGGAFHDDLKTDYRNMWNFLESLNTAMLTRSNSDYGVSGLTFMDYKSYALQNSNDIVLDLDKRSTLISITDIEDGEKSLITAEASFSEYEGEDFSKVNKTGNGSFADNTFSTEMSLNNIPSVDNDAEINNTASQREFIANALGLKNVALELITTENLKTRAFYLKYVGDTISDDRIFDKDGISWYRIHSYTSYDLGNSVESNTFYPYTPLTAETGFPIIDVQSIALTQQADASTARCNAESVYYLYSNPYMITSSCTDYVWKYRDGNNLPLLDFANYRFTLDYDNTIEITDWFANNPTNHYIVKSELDLITGQIEFELIGH